MYAYVKCGRYDVGELEWSEEHGCWQVFIGEDCWVDFDGETQVSAMVHLIIGNESCLVAHLGYYGSMEEAYEDVTYRLTEGRGIESYKWIVDYV